MNKVVLNEDNKQQNLIKVQIVIVSVYSMYTHETCNNSWHTSEQKSQKYSCKIRFVS